MVSVLLLSFLGFLVVCFLVGVVSFLQSRRSALWSGALLMATGLVMSLFVMTLVREASPAEQAFYVNVWLIVAAVGANFFVTAVSMGLRNSKP